VSYPSKRDLDYSYTGFAAGQGDNSFPGSNVDDDLANLKASVDELIDFVSASIRSDNVISVSALPEAADLTAYTAQSAASASTATAQASVATAKAVLTAADAVNTAASAAAALVSQNAAAATLSGAAVKANNLSDLANSTTARTNLGLDPLVVQTGQLGYFILSSSPTGWVKANGLTIGNASSGGSGRANADTAALFALIWALDSTSFPITTSAGAGSTRGVSAAADFAANKRLPLPDLRGEFIRGFDDGRGVDSGRSLGSAQVEMIGPHQHSVSSASSNTNNTSGAFNRPATSSADRTSVITDTNPGTENRPRNVAFLACIKL
jgi:microcystin-dependent protein